MGSCSMVWNLVDLPLFLNENCWYQSAEGYGYGAWNFPVPDYPELWGIQILRVTAAEADTLTALLQQTDENRLSGGGTRSMKTARGCSGLGRIEAGSTGSIPPQKHSRRTLTH